MVKGKPFAPQRGNEGHWSDFREQNNFSKHDNRHLLQDNGEYFGNGLGKRIMKNKSQHVSQKGYLTGLSHDLSTSNQKSSYQDSYGNNKNKQCQSPCLYRRFSRQQKVDQTYYTKGLSTHTTKWWTSSDQPFSTSIQVLAITQPCRGPNKWRYSYQSTIFPFVDTWKSYNVRNKTI